MDDDNRRDYDYETRRPSRGRPDRPDRSRRSHNSHNANLSEDPGAPPPRPNRSSRRLADDQSWESVRNDYPRPSGGDRPPRDQDDVRSYRSSNTRSKRDQRAYREDQSDGWDDWDSDKNRHQRDRLPSWPLRMEDEDRARPRQDQFISPARPRPSSPVGGRSYSNRSGNGRDRSREDEEEQYKERLPRLDAPRDDRVKQDGRGTERGRRHARPDEDELASAPPRRGRAEEQWQDRGGHQRNWSSWDDEPAGRYNQGESAWLPAWQRDQSATEDWSDPDRPSGRGRPQRPQRDRRGPRGSLAETGYQLAETGYQLAQTGYQWALTQQRRILSTRRGRVVAAVVAASLLLATLGSVGLAYAQYSHVKSEASTAVASLKSAETSLKTLESNPFDTTAISQAESQLGQAHADFVQMNNAIQAIPGIFAVTPIVGSKLDAAFKIGPIAVEATQAGILGCQILEVLAPALKNPLATNISGLTSTDMTNIQAKFATVYSLVSTLLGQVQQLPPSASSLDPRLGSILATVSIHMPEFTQGLQDVKNLMEVLPQLLGVGKPANYLMEVMDSTELRPGGGFVGNFGSITLSGGRMQGKPQIKDVDLLDQHYKGISRPSQFSWFTSGGSTLGFRDSNLDADFPSDAARAIQEYSAENGSALLSNNAGPITQFQGVIAITPWLIANALTLTGSIKVPYFNTVVTASNLIQQIHYWQLTPLLGGSDTEIDPACGSSYRKAFTCYLFKAFLSKLSSVSATNFGGLGKLLISSIHTKDIQIYLTDRGAEGLLLHHDLASALNAPQSGDGLMVVDANIDGIKANNYMNYIWNDQISLDSSGNATHHLVLTYQYPASNAARADAHASPSAYCSASAYAYCYQDFLRIYIPANSTHVSVPANTPLAQWPSGSPYQSSGFGMTIIQGLMYIPMGSAPFTVSVSWTVPHAAVPTAGGLLFQYAIQKQAGITWPTMNVALTLPSCAHFFGSLQGFTTPTAHTAVVKEPLASDTTLSLQYTC